MGSGKPSLYNCRVAAEDLGMSAAVESTSGHAPAPGRPVQTDVLIAGGGMVGLAAAIALGQAGIPCLAVDSEPAEQRVSAGYDGRSSAIAYAFRRGPVALRV